MGVDQVTIWSIPHTISLHLERLLQKWPAGFSPFPLSAMTDNLRASLTGGSFFIPGGVHAVASNPRSANGNLRRKHRARFKAMGAPCGICRGALGPIHYDEPSDAQHPLSFVIDEIIPISKATRYGYESREEAARDWDNLQPAHWICNSKKRDRVGPGTQKAVKAAAFLSDGSW